MSMIKVSSGTVGEPKVLLKYDGFGDLVVPSLEEYVGLKSDGWEVNQSQIDIINEFCFFGMGDGINKLEELKRKSRANRDFVFMDIKGLLVHRDFVVIAARFRSMGFQHIATEEIILGLIVANIFELSGYCGLRIKFLDLFESFALCNYIVTLELKEENYEYVFKDLIKRFGEPEIEELFKKYLFCSEHRGYLYNMFVKVAGMHLDTKLCLLSIRSEVGGHISLIGNKIFVGEDRDPSLLPRFCRPICKMIGGVVLEKYEYVNLVKGGVTVVGWGMELRIDNDILVRRLCEKDFYSFIEESSGRFSSWGIYGKTSKQIVSAFFDLGKLVCNYYKYYFDFKVNEALVDKVILNRLMFILKRKHGIKRYVVLGGLIRYYKVRREAWRKEEEEKEKECGGVRET